MKKDAFKYLSHISSLLLSLVLFSFFSVTLFGQAANNTLHGIIKDNTGQPLTGIVVQIPKLNAGTVTDSNGKYNITNLPAGKYAVQVSALSFKPETANIVISGITEYNFTLIENVLDKVTVKASKLMEIHTVSHTEISGLELLQTRGESLGESLKELPGLNSVQTGPTLSKPVIHGLSNNRVLIMNDGIRQEGQQWGSEHAPEIDPFVANKISVVKGAASVRYGSDAIGGVVMLSPDALPTTKGISGDVYLVGATNGQMGAFSTALQGGFDKKLSGLAWRIQGTLKDAGNFSTPRYYLTNTGLHEGDFSASVCYKWKKFDFDAYYSQYYTEVGICLAAQSNSLAELQRKSQMLTPGIPSYFTYDIARPYQTVDHSLFKTTAAYSFDNKSKIELTFGWQNDIRQEFDDISVAKNTAAYSTPQLRFQLITHSIDLIYTQQAKNGFTGSFGLCGKTSGNIFEGVRSLIPNFRDYNIGAFAIERYSLGKFTFEAGLRQDYRWLQVYERQLNTLGLYDVTYQYTNATGTVGATYRYNNHLSASFNIGSGWRAPSINEMYINGEHFSDASYQVGDSTLKSERSLNTGLSVNYTSNKLRASIDVYYNQINNYIYEKPSLTLRHLASGTFPEFDYTQANVNIRGIDGVVQYDIHPLVTLQSKTTIVRGFNESINNWLIYMPCDRFENGLVFHLGSIGKLKEPYFSVENVSVSKQIRVPPNSDFVAPPLAYSIFNANAGFTIPIHKNTLNVSFTVNNITNLAYRDYLDHFRYYVDELGINYILRIKYSF